MLEKYMKQDGAVYRPRFKRVLDTSDISLFKGQREINVENIVVNHTIESGGTYNFQGDEQSQNRLVRSGWAMEKTNTLTISWKTSDNQTVQLTVTDIANILLKSGQAQSALWF